MTPEQILSAIANQASINDERALITVRIISDEDFTAAYGTEAWSVVNLTISQGTADHLKEGE